MAGAAVTIGLSAVVMAQNAGELSVLTVQAEPGSPTGLPAGPFDPASHRTFELALRDFVTAQTGLGLGYVEQLYTFGDAGRETPQARFGSPDDGRIVSVGYLALAPDADVASSGAAWTSLTDCFPYEDWRYGRPEALDAIAPALCAWSGDDVGRRARAEALFALDDATTWRDERVLERYELLYEAGLVAEAARDRLETIRPHSEALGAPMVSDHRRILATGLGRLRGKLRYRAVLFDLLPERFTLSQLQKSAEGVIGLRLHKQNFRRGVERAALVEPTGEMRAGTGGRPAEVYRRRHEATGEAQSTGLVLPIRR